MAKKKIEREDLGYLGEEAQRKIVKGLLEDKRLMMRVSSFINANAFTDSTLRVIVGLVVDYYRKNSVVPSYMLLETLVKQYYDNEIDLNISMDMIKLLKSDELSEELNEYKQMALAFFQQQKLVKVLTKAIKDVGTGGYKDDDILDCIDELKKVVVGEDDDSVISYDSLLDEIALGAQDTEKIPTGLRWLDGILHGGLEKGRLGLIVAPSGRGKTTLSTIMASNAALAGKKVLQIIFEDTEKTVITKHYAKLLDVYTSTIAEKGLTEEYKERLRAYTPIFRPNMKLKRMKNGYTTWNDIEAFIDSLEASTGWKPDVVIIDYFDCLKKSTDGRLSDWEASNRCARKMEGYAGEKNIAIWVFQQTNRNALKEITKNDLEANVQGGFGLIQVSSCNVFLVRELEDMKNNAASFYCTKNRQGEVDDIKGIYLNNGNLGYDDTQVVDTQEYVLDKIYEVENRI